MINKVRMKPALRVLCTCTNIAQSIFKGRRDTKDAHIKRVTRL